MYPTRSLGHVKIGPTEYTLHHTVPGEVEPQDPVVQIDQNILHGTIKRFVILDATGLPLETGTSIRLLGSFRSRDTYTSLKQSICSLMIPIRDPQSLTWIEVERIPWDFAGRHGYTMSIIGGDNESVEDYFKLKVRMRVAS